MKVRNPEAWVRHLRALASRPHWRGAETQEEVADTLAPEAKLLEPLLHDVCHCTTLGEPVGKWMFTLEHHTKAAILDRPREQWILNEAHTVAAEALVLDALGLCPSKVNFVSAITRTFYPTWARKRQTFQKQILNRMRTKQARNDARRVLRRLRYHLRNEAIE